MNAKKMRILFLLIAILLFIIVWVSVMINNKNDNSNINDKLDDIDNDDYAFHFSETLDLEAENVSKEADMGTDYTSLGTISEFYDGTDIKYKEDKIYMDSFEGTIIISASWMDESFAKNIKEPEFGNLEKFVLKPNSANARYSDVSMKNVTSYINELSGLGFSNVVKNEKDKKADKYIYSAKKDDLTVTLNYEQGYLVIIVF